MRKIESAPAKMMWVIREIYIWQKHSKSDRVVEIPYPKHLNTVRVFSTDIWGSYKAVGCKWIVAAAQEYMEGQVHTQREAVGPKNPGALYTHNQLGGRQSHSHYLPHPHTSSC